MMQPLKVIFHLAAPVIPPDNGMLHLDGLLAYAVVQDALRNDPDAAASNYPALQSGLGRVLASETVGADSVFKASAVVFEERDPSSVGGSVRLIRRTDVEGITLAKENFDRNGERHTLHGDEEHFPGAMLATFPKSNPPRSLRQTTINLASGELRNFLFYLPTFHAKRAVAWCIGDADEILRLCKTHIRSIGRRGAAGFGAVADVEVVPATDAQQLWMRRQLPWQPDDSYVPIEGNIAPPYWDARLRKIVWIPADL